MSNTTRCDLCDMVLMPKFSDLGYKVSVKELEHSYDGYNPWVRRTKLDICETCMERIVMAIQEQVSDLANTSPETTTAPVKSAPVPNTDSRELSDITELYIILADYSNDLNSLKKRNGKLPAEAAIECFLEWVEQEVVGVDDRRNKKYWPDETVDTINAARNSLRLEQRQALKNKRKEL